MRFYRSKKPKEMMSTGDETSPPKPASSVFYVNTGLAVIKPEMDRQYDEEYAQMYITPIKGKNRPQRKRKENVCTLQIVLDYETGSKITCHIQSLSVADPKFSRGGAPTPKSANIFQNFFRKLHENERIWTPKGGACPWRPLGSANDYVFAYHILLLWKLSV